VVDAGSLLWLLVQLAALLVCALALGRLAVHLGLPAVIGELLTGILLGPSVLGALAPSVSRWLFPPDAEQSRLLQAVGLVGMVLFVGLTGMEIDVQGLRRRRSSLVWVSLCGLVLPFVLGVAAGLKTPTELLVDESHRMVFSLFLGVALSVSAIPVIAKILSDMRLLHRDISQLTLGVAVIDDAVGWCLLGAVSAFSLHGLDGRQAVSTLVQLLLFVLLAALSRRPVQSLLASTSGSHPRTGAVGSLAVVMGYAALAHVLSLEAVFGAFIGGLVAGPARYLRPFKPVLRYTLSALATVAFAIAGLRVDLQLLTEPLAVWTGLTFLVLAIVGKFSGAYLGARISRLTRWEGIALGAGLNARGMIQVVVATVGLRVGLLSETTYTLLVLVALTTSLMAPPMLRWAMHRIEPTAPEIAREARRSPSGTPWA
jgi:Kef-type K+ transport system membrane component KefB